MLTEQHLYHQLLVAAFSMPVHALKLHVACGDQSIALCQHVMHTVISAGCIVLHELLMDSSEQACPAGLLN